jgi:hypothetical protein
MLVVRGYPADVRLRPAVLLFKLGFWTRIESGITSWGGGGSIGVPDPDSNDAPTLRLEGFTAFGGVAVGAKPAG